MNSPNRSLSRWFRGSGATPSKATEPAGAAPRTSRRSIAFGEFMRGLEKELKAAGEHRLSILDLGSTSPANIFFLTELGLRVSSEDVLRSCRDPEYIVHREDGSEEFDADKFLSENLSYPEHQFDAVLCWDVPDYVPEQLVKPLVDRVYAVLKPKGTLLALFHDKNLGSDSPSYRYHIVERDTLEVEPRIGDFRLQRVFNNRHVENLFANFTSRKFFLGRDNFREVIVVR